jgi:hypothetical protein
MKNPSARFERGTPCATFRVPAPGELETLLWHAFAVPA